jgi:hypothetical protein
MNSSERHIADQKLIESARETLITNGHEVLDGFDIEAYQCELDAQPPNTNYSVFSPSARAMWEDLLHRFGSKGFAIIHCSLMIDAIVHFTERLPPDGYPESILDCFRGSYTRILSKIKSLDLTGYDKPRDLMFKDLGICRQTLIPGGARVIEPMAAFPRSLIIRGGLRQFFEASSFILFKAHGSSPFFNLHTHDYELSEFNEEGWRRLFLRIADLLEARPYIKGVFVGSGWLYDPNLPLVSPRLSYHLGLTVPNGARSFFYAHDTKDSYAFVKSATRRRLFEEGKYRPALHVLIWPRKQLLAWARNVSKSQPEA